MRDLSFLIWKVRDCRPCSAALTAQVSKGLLENIKGCAFGRGFPYLFLGEEKKKREISGRSLNFGASRGQRQRRGLVVFEGW